MRRLGTLVALLILLSGAAPLLACMTGSAMSHEESACCRSMHGNCGGMKTMGCCRTVVRSDAQPQLARSAQTLDRPAVVVVAFVSFSVPALTVLRALLQPPDEHSPPGLRNARTTVLRI